MQIAPEITFEGSDSSDAARAQILSEIERLETHNHRITGCRVKVIAPSHKHRHGVGFQVHIWLTLPPHENIVVNQTGLNDARHEHAQVAIKDAFAAAREIVLRRVGRAQACPPFLARTASVAPAQARLARPNFLNSTFRSPV